MTWFAPVDPQGLRGTPDDAEDGGLVECSDVTEIVERARSAIGIVESALPVEVRNQPLGFIGISAFDDRVLRVEVQLISR
ncbi:Uncharacterised protein [Mycobacteroides abscessus subsp. abscessus]|nr:Uncharacterised protein [Mycobacteroides abscessus subsp. abscessus]